ncbi:MAG: hypothetical protein ACM3X1_10335 [Ignavibacteriales bacterium]
METKIIKSSHLEKKDFAVNENIMKTDLKSNISIEEMSLDQVVKILDKQLANDYALFTKTLHPRLGSCSTSLLGGDHYD